MNDPIRCGGTNFLSAQRLETKTLAHRPLIIDLAPTAKTLRIVEAIMIAADEETIATDPTGPIGMEAGTAVHVETAMQESRAVVTVMKDMIAVLVYYQGQMQPVIEILTMSQYSQDDRCGIWRPTTVAASLYKMAVGNSQALGASHGIVVMPEVKEGARIPEVMVVVVEDRVKNGPPAHGGVPCVVRETAREMVREREYLGAWATNDETTVATTATLRGSGGAMLLRCRQTTGTRG